MCTLGHQELFIVSHKPLTLYFCTPLEKIITHYIDFSSSTSESQIKIIKNSQLSEQRTKTAMSFLAAFEDLRKATTSSVMSVRFSVSMEQLVYHCTDLHPI